MLENFMELFENKIGYFLILGIFMTIFCTILKFKKTKVNSDYKVVNCDSMKSVVYYYMLINQVFVIYFVIEYILGIVDETGAKLDKHILLFLGTLFFFHYMFLWCHYKNIYFNNDNIEVHSFLRKSKIYNWESIISVKKNKMNDLIVKTIDGGKFCIEFAFNNKINFERELESRGISIIKK